MEAPAAIAGIHAIPVTPFRRDGSVEEEELGAVVERIVASGIEVVVACGNTAEYASLTNQEAERVAALTIEAAAGALALVGVGGPLASALEQTRIAMKRGARGIMIHFPSDPYLSDDGILSYYRTLAAATDGLVVLYLRRHGIGPGALEQAVAIDNVVAVKYAIPDVLGFAEFAATHGDSIVPICGLAEMWAPFFWLAGARGFTSGLVNVAPHLSLQMLAALRANDLATAMTTWQLIAPFERLRARNTNSLNVSTVKEAMALLNLIRHSTVRPPISNLTPHQQTELKELLATWPVHA